MSINRPNCLFKSQFRSANGTDFRLAFAFAQEDYAVARDSLERLDEAGGPVHVNCSLGSSAETEVKSWIV